MEHIWQSSQEHTSGSFDVAEDIAGLRPAAYLGAVSVFPVCNKAEKFVSISCIADMGHPEKNIPELSAIGGPGGVTAPSQALPLNMDKASLDYSIRPELSDDPYYVRVAVHCKAAGFQSI